LLSSAPTAEKGSPTFGEQRMDNLVGGLPSLEATMQHERAVQKPCFVPIDTDAETPHLVVFVVAIVLLIGRRIQRFISSVTWPTVRAAGAIAMGLIGCGMSAIIPGRPVLASTIVRVVRVVRAGGPGMEHRDQAPGLADGSSAYGCQPILLKALSTPRAVVQAHGGVRLDQP
jgi:hypothetical protein